MRQGLAVWSVLLPYGQTHNCRKIIRSKPGNAFQGIWAADGNCLKGILLLYGNLLWGFHSIIVAELDLR